MLNLVRMPKGGGGGVQVVGVPVGVKGINLQMCRTVGDQPKTRCHCKFSIERNAKECKIPKAMHTELGFVYGCACVSVWVCVCA